MAAFHIWATGMTPKRNSRTFNPSSLSPGKNTMMHEMDKIAAERDTWLYKNRYYHNDMKKFLQFTIPEGSSVLEIGCGTGDLLNSSHPVRGVGIDISSEMVRIARAKYPHLEFLQMDAENITLSEKFEYIIISDTLGDIEDIQAAFRELHKVTLPSTKIIITFHSFLWTPVLRLAEFLRLKMPQERLNWLNREDIAGLLYIEGFELVKQGQRLIIPRYMPLVSSFLNRWIANLPILNRLCITGYLIARPTPSDTNYTNHKTVSVVVPACNERGNIESLVKRVPRMGFRTEVIFIEGHSTDGTLEEIEHVCREYSSRTLKLHCSIQDGEGKADAIRKGFSLATGEILMILDADLTVMPEDLQKFYQVISSGKGEFVNGSRLVYPMEKESMRLLNILGNKFFCLTFSWLLGQRLKDTLCGTKVISKENYLRLAAGRKYFGEFDPFGDFDLLFGAAKLNLKIVEIPVRYQSRKYGATNISRFKHGWLLLKMVVFATRKIKFV